MDQKPEANDYGELLACCSRTKKPFVLLLAPPKLGERWLLLEARRIHDPQDATPDGDEAPPGFVDVKFPLVAAEDYQCPWCGYPSLGLNTMTHEVTCCDHLDPKYLYREERQVQRLHNGGAYSIGGLCRAIGGLASAAVGLIGDGVKALAEPKKKPEVSSTPRFVTSESPRLRDMREQSARLGQRLEALDGSTTPAPKPTSSLPVGKPVRPLPAPRPTKPPGPTARVRLGGGTRQKPPALGDRKSSHRLLD